MSKKKQEEVLTEKEQAVMDELDQKIAGIEASKEAEKLKKEAEEAAFDRLCRAMGKDPEALRAQEKAIENINEPMEYDLGNTVCRINGIRYSGRGVAPRGIAEQIMNMASNRRGRLLKELVGHEHILKELQGGGFTMKPVRKIKTDLE
jgi:hypothetical protein